jgi:hypothetical protein
MAIAQTYVPIATTTFSNSSTNNYTFSSIPSSYTDLVIIMSATQNGSSAQNILMQFNGDSGSNYSVTMMGSGGGTPESQHFPNVSNIQLDRYGYPSSGSDFNTYVINIMNYSNTTTYKTILNRDGKAISGGTEAWVGLWRNTAAINSIKLFFANYYFNAGSTITLYGIASA